jgi:hypothetical protein
VNVVYEYDFFSPMDYASQNWHEQSVIYNFLTNADASMLRGVTMDISKQKQSF